MAIAFSVQVYYAVILTVLVTIAALAARVVSRLGETIRLKKAHLTVTLRRQFMDLQATIAKDEDPANLYQRGLRGFTGLSDTEQTRFFIISSFAFTHWSEIQRHVRAGLVPDEYWQEVLKLIRDYAQYPGVQEFWH